MEVNIEVEISYHRISIRLYVGGIQSVGNFMTVFISDIKTIALLSKKTYSVHNHFDKFCFPYKYVDSYLRRTGSTGASKFYRLPLP